MQTKNEADVQQKTTELSCASPKSSQIYLHFLVPAILKCVVYMIHFSADLVVSVQHFRENKLIWGWSTIGLMYLPAFVYFILTISRPGWWMKNSCSLKTKQKVIWYFLQVAKCAAFPLYALYRFSGLIVLSIDAITLKDKKRQALELVSKPEAIELYFFLQAWFQAAPQAVLQTHSLFIYNLERYSSRTSQSVAVQVLCILMSIIVLAEKCASFQYYESQRISGRAAPWAMWIKKNKMQEENVEENKLLLVNNQSENKLKTNVNLNADPKVTMKDSTTPPLPPKNVKIIAPPTPLRRITSLTPLPLPEYSAPMRPDSISVGANNVTVPDPQDIFCGEIKSKSLDNITMIKKKSTTKDLENYNGLCTALFSIVWWFFFIAPRVLAIIIFFEFYPLCLLIVISIHYSCAISYLFYVAKYNDLTSFFINLWLGFVFIFGIIEYRVKFRQKWMQFYYIFVNLQNIFMTLTWYFFENWNGYLYSFCFLAIFACMSLTIMLSIIHCSARKKVIESM